MPGGADGPPSHVGSSCRPPPRSRERAVCLETAQRRKSPLSRTLHVTDSGRTGLPASLCPRETRRAVPPTPLAGRGGGQARGAAEGLRRLRAGAEGFAGRAPRAGLAHLRSEVAGRQQRPGGTDIWGHCDPILTSGENLAASGRPSSSIVVVVGTPVTGDAPWATAASVLRLPDGAWSTRRTQWLFVGHADVIACPASAAAPSPEIRFLARGPERVSK